jgi:hypothetical protein
MQIKKYVSQRSPTLSTILMIEDVLKKQEDIITIGKLKRLLPKQIMHPTLMATLQYLSNSGKIVVSHSKVLWTYNPKSILQTLSKEQITSLQLDREKQSADAK